VDFSRGFLLDRKATQTEKEFIRNTLEKMVLYQKRKRLSLKITGPGRVGYLQSIFPDAIFIEIIREPFANIRSLLNVPFWKSRGMHRLWWQGAYTEDEKNLAKEWKDKPALMTALQYKKVRETNYQEVNKYRVNHLVIKYEDFIANPNATIEKILSYTNLSRSKNVDKYLKMNKIYNRNKNALEGFTQEEIDSIRSMVGTLIE